KVITKAMTEPTYVTIGLAWKKDKYLSYATRALIKFIEDYIKEHLQLNNYICSSTKISHSSSASGGILLAGL
ncbi:LysR family transcriptional regulator, partial [Salmonella enterica subsp. enterica serovar Newport]|nr:LysR family transcriptional regulator [Salmonella enterica subsp. enterica serovar Newport]